MSYGIMFSNDPSVVWYFDSDYVGDMNDWRSTIKYVFTITWGPICWKSLVQSIMSMSTPEVEYMVAGEAAKEAMVCVRPQFWP